MAKIFFDILLDTEANVCFFLSTILVPSEFAMVVPFNFHHLKYCFLYAFKYICYAAIRNFLFKMPSLS